MGWGRWSSHDGAGPRQTARGHDYAIDVHTMRANRALSCSHPPPHLVVGKQSLSFLGGGLFCARRRRHSWFINRINNIHVCACLLHVCMYAGDQSHTWNKHAHRLLRTLYVQAGKATAPEPPAFRRHVEGLYLTAAAMWVGLQALVSWLRGTPSLGPSWPQGRWLSLARLAGRTKQLLRTSSIPPAQSYLNQSRVCPRYLRWLLSGVPTAPPYGGPASPTAQMPPAVMYVECRLNVESSQYINIVNSIYK